MLRIVNTLILIYISLVLFANEKIEYYHINHITSANGLPHSLVFNLDQGNDGFIWVATNNGLGRFDGYTFKTFRPNSNKANSISSKSITHLFIDNQRNLWLSIQGIGLNRMSLDTESIYEYLPSDSTENSISGNDVFCFYQSHDSTVWIGTNKGLDKYNTHSNKITQVTTPFVENLYVHQIYEDKNKNIWISANNNIWCYNTQQNTLKNLSELSNNRLFSSYSINSSIFVENYLLVIATENNGIIGYNTISNTIDFKYPQIPNTSNLFYSPEGDLYFIGSKPYLKLFIIPNLLTKPTPAKTLIDFKDKTIPYYVSFCSDADNNTWLTIGEGLYKVNKKHEVSRIFSKTNFKTDILNQNIYVELADNMNNLWLRSERNGIVKIDLNQKQFTTYTNYKNKNEIISGKNISMVYNDSKGNIWVGCHSKGVTCFNPTEQTFINYDYDAYDTKKLNYRAPAGISEDKNGDIWIGFYDGCLVKINPKLRKVKQYYTHKDSSNYFPGYSIRCIINDKQGNLWFATNTKGLVEYDFRSQSFIEHSQMFEHDFLSNSHYRFLTQTNDGIFWTGTQNGGLGKYDKSVNKFIHYKHNPENSTSISGNTVYYIYEQNDSLLWVGTDKGLNIFDRKNEIFKQIAISDNNSICAVYRIYPDNNGNLWLSGDCGLIKLNATTFKSTIYKNADGLPGNEFNTTAGYVNNNGVIFLGSSNGLVSFHPEEIKPNSYHAKPVLTQLKIFNKTVAPNQVINDYVILKKELSLCEEINLPYSLNDFTIEFSSMHFAAPEKNQYQYKLEGYNSDWINTTANRRWANFTGLKHGEYTFKLRATNSDGIMCQPADEVSLKITIKPPFYRTALFQLGIILLLIALVFLFFRLRFDRIKNQKKTLEHLVQNRTKELIVKNNLLNDRQEEISLQKTELEKHRNHLEELVKERTNDLAKALHKAEESDRLKSAFLSNMSHEIRTPMNAILGFSSLLLDDTNTAIEKIEYAEIIQSNGESLLNLLNDIIDISIIESGQLSINNRPTPLHNLVNEVVLTFSSNGICLTNKYITIKNQSPKIIIETDPARLKQVLVNLISNAIKYTKYGQIEINYVVIENIVQFEVKDTGIGIGKEKLAFIFDRFNKIEDKSDEMYRGGGLGLAICKNLINAMGGKIWVESEEGIGSSFFFTLALK